MMMFPRFPTKILPWCFFLCVCVCLFVGVNVHVHCACECLYQAQSQFQLKVGLFLILSADEQLQLKWNQRQKLEVLKNLKRQLKRGNTICFSRLILAEKCYNQLSKSVPSLITILEKKTDGGISLRYTNYMYGDKCIKILAGIVTTIFNLILLNRLFYINKMPMSS